MLRTVEIAQTGTEQIRGSDGEQARAVLVVDADRDAYALFLGGGFGYPDSRARLTWRTQQKHSADDVGRAVGFGKLLVLQRTAVFACNLLDLEPIHVQLAAQSAEDLRQHRIGRIGSNDD